MERLGAGTAKEILQDMRQHGVPGPRVRHGMDALRKLVSWGYVRLDLATGLYRVAEPFPVNVMVVSVGRRHRG